MKKIINRTQFRTLVVFCLIAAIVLTISLSKNFSSSAQKAKQDGDIAPEAPLAGTISGRVYQDYNGNGVYDTTTTLTNNGFGTTANPIDRGIAGVTVSAFDPAGVARGTATTAADGTYALAATGTGPYRVEFTTLPTGYSPSARSTDSVLGGTATNSGSTVQFVNDLNTTNVNLAVNYPTDYSQNNPEIVASMYSAGDQLTGVNSNTSVMVSFPYSAGSTDSTAGATESLYDAPVANPLDVVANQLGTTFGIAYARQSRLIYSAAFFKRHAGFGPQGPNAIYRVSRTGSGTVTGFFTVPGTATNSHNTADYNRDNNNVGWDAVGKSSLGGLAISENESTLYVINLANRTLYSLNASTGAQLASQSIDAAVTLPTPLGNCAAADERPFAVTMYRNQLYVGIVCSAESTTNVDTFTDSNANGIWDAGDYYLDANNNNVRNAGESYFNLTGGAGFDASEPFTDGDGNGVYNLGNANGLRAYVYSVNPTTLAFGASPILQVPMNYRRGLTTHTVSALGAWRPWSTVYRNASTNDTRTVYSQPMLTDIAFDNGNIVLGLRDRIGDQVGNGALSNPNNPSNVIFYQPRTAGDVIRACGALAAWTIESNGRCGGTGTAPQNVAEGPGGGEFYHGDAYDLADDFVSPAVTVSGKGGNHADTGNGGVEQLPGAPDLIITNFDAIANIPNMTHDGGIRWLNNNSGDFAKGYRMYDGVGNDTGNFGKAGGIGGSIAILADPAPIEIGNRVWRDANANGVQDPGELPIGGITVRLYQGSTLIGTAVTDANGEYYFSSAAGTSTGNTIFGLNLLYNTAYQVRFDNPVNYNAGGPLFGLLLTRLNETSQFGDDDSSDSDASTVANPPGSPAGNFPVISLTTGGPGANNHTFDVGFAAQPTAANVSVEGRVLLSAGNGVRNATVFLLEANGTQHSAITGSFGYYRFPAIEAGQTVVVSVRSKRFTFNPPTRVVTLTDAVSDLDFIAEE